MNIISMSVYFVFDTRRTHKNKRQIPHANNAQPIGETPGKRLPALLSLSSLGSLVLNGKSMKTFGEL